MYETLMNACRLYISETIHQYYRNTFILVLQEIRQNSQNVENFPLVFLIPLLQFNNIALQKDTHFFSHRLMLNLSSDASLVLVTL